eukprot:7340657-Alexandrium_andersonii.AAC.1
MANRSALDGARCLLTIVEDVLVAPVLGAGVDPGAGPESTSMSMWGPAGSESATQWSRASEITPKI